MSHGNPHDHAIHGWRRWQPLEAAFAAAREYLRTPCGGVSLARRDLEPNPFASIRAIRGSLLFSAWNLGLADDLHLRGNPR